MLLISFARALVFMSLAFSGVIPMAHVAVIGGYAGLEGYPLANLALTCGSYLVGTMAYVYRVPEPYCPGVFDLWVGHSSPLFGSGIFSAN